MADKDGIRAVDSDGKVVYEYDMATGTWLEAISEAIQAAEQHFDDLGYPTDGVEFVEGEVTVTGRVDGVKVFEMNIKSGEVMFDQNYVIEQAGQQDLMPTDIEPREDVLKATGQYHVDDRNVSLEYFLPLYNERVRPLFIEIYGHDPYVQGKSGTKRIMLDPEINAWGSISDLSVPELKFDRFIFYELGNGKVVIVPLMPEK
jgi:hypothetical protein